MQNNRRAFIQLRKDLYSNKGPSVEIAREDKAFLQSAVEVVLSGGEIKTNDDVYWYLNATAWFMISYEKHCQEKVLRMLVS